VFRGGDRDCRVVAGNSLAPNASFHRTRVEVLRFTATCCPAHSRLDSADVPKRRGIVRHSPMQAIRVRPGLQFWARKTVRCAVCPDGTVIA